MISRTHLSAIILVAALVWAILLLIDGVGVSIGWLRHLSAVVAIVLVLITAFDIWLWKLWFLRGWFVKRTNIGGTWHATIRSNWHDPSTGESIPPTDGYMAIHQRYSSLSLRLMTNESTSQLLGAEIIKSLDGTFRIAGVYRNEPRQAARQAGHMHYGAVILDVIGNPPSSLRGHYWTDRGTSGEIDLNSRSKRTFDDYDEAKRACT
jgi:hypothetical protein